MEIELGTVNLTRKQQERFPNLHGGKINGFVYTDGKVYANVSSDLTPQEKNQLLTSLTSLATGPLPDDLEKEELLSLEEFVEDNVKDFNTAKVALKKIAKLLAKRLN